jgi:chromosome segregation ATPase
VIPASQSSEFVAHMENVLTVYEKPYDRDFPVICMDESPKQLIKETRLPIPAKPGSLLKYDYEYERCGSCNIFLASEPLSGKRIVKVTEKKAEEELATGIVEIDVAVKSLKEELANETNKLELIEKRIDLANNKIIVLQKERDLYEAEKNNLFMEENAQEEIKQLEEKIKQINEDIAVEKNKIIDLDLSKLLARNKIQDLENQISDYSREYKTEYEKKEGFDRYIQKETERLTNELAQMEERKNQLSEGWKELAVEKENLQNKISGYETEIELLKGKEISEVVSELAELEKDEAKLLEQEAQQLKEEKEQLRSDTVTTSTDQGELDELRKKVTEEKSKIAEDEEKLAKEKQELMQKQQEATQERAEKLYTWPLTILIIVGLIIIGLVALFFIGKNVRTKKKAA